MSREGTTTTESIESMWVGTEESVSKLGNFLVDVESHYVKPQISTDFLRSISQFSQHMASASRWTLCCNINGKTHVGNRQTSSEILLIMRFPVDIAV